MKRYKALCSLLLVMTLLFGSVSVAEAAEIDSVPVGLHLDDANDRVTTLVTFVSGDEYLADGTVDLTTTERQPIVETIENYEVLFDDDVILTVEPRDIIATGSSSEMPNGYYAIDFAIPFTEQECFLTGLSPAKVELIQDMLIDSYAANSEFVLEDADFIDAEKTNNGDSLQCWAGTVSNMLCYSGWGKQVGFATEDDIYDLFRDSFKDEGYQEINGIEWFFNGIAGSVNADEEMVKDFGNSGGYLNDYPSDQVASDYHVVFDYPRAVGRMLDKLKSGSAIGLSLYTTPESAHAITLWGCITDNRYDKKDMAHYSHLIIGDSDDDKGVFDERRLAPNSVRVHELQQYDDVDQAYPDGLDTYYAIDNMLLYKYTELLPYSETVVKETDPAASKNKLDNIDFAIKNPYISNIPFGYEQVTDAYAGDVWVFFDVQNHSRLDYEGDVNCRAILYRDGEKVSENETPLTNHWFFGQKRQLQISLGNLPAGEYSVTLSVAPDPQIQEAYYCNNTVQYDFTLSPCAYDLSQMQLGVQSLNKINIGSADVRLDCSRIDPALLSGAERFVLRESFLLNGERTESERVMDIKSYNDEYPGLPDEFSLFMPDKTVQLELLIMKDGMAYSVTSDVLSIPVIRYEVELSEDTGTITPIACGSSKLNDGEEIRFRVLNTSIGYDQPIKARVTPVIYDEGSDRCTAVTQPHEVTLGQDGAAAFSFTDFLCPMTASTSICLRVEGEIDGEAFCFYTYSFVWISVIEQGGSSVDLDEDIVDPYDGMTGLSEAIAYCKENGLTDVTFAPEIRSLTLHDPLVIDSAITLVNQDPDSPIELHSDGSRYIEVQDGGSLHMNGFRFSNEPGEALEPKEKMLFCREGEMVLENCGFHRIATAEDGGLIAVDSGKAVLKNCFFEQIETDDESIICIGEDASLSMLNCLLDYTTTGRDVIRNLGRMTMINSAIMNAFSSGSDAVLIRCDGEADLVNSVLIGNHVPEEVSGAASLHGCAYGNVSDSVTVDRCSGTFEIGELYKTDWLDGYPIIRYDFKKLRPYPLLEKGAMNGFLVTTDHGELCLSRDGESTVATGVVTDFTDEELALDIYGTPRRTIFGPYAVLASDYVLGDADNDGTVDVTDATMIQRYEAHALAYADTGMTTRGDVDRDGELSIIDVTLIQRWLGQVKVNYPIGELQFTA